ncbi:MAG: ketosteroid isomerase-like protein [Cyclobacteriaceae bacterium]|jgi:ketosteroid isomerase-like protein
MNYLEREREVQRMISVGLMMEAFEKFYHEDVIMIESTGEIREGKAFNRTFQQEWIFGIKEVHDSGVKSITSNEESAVTMSETWIELSFRDGSRMKMEEVSVKQWDGDQIINERFYYDTDFDE